MKRSVLNSGFGLVAALCAGVAAWAAVMIDDEGLGFVGKGDVQIACDWNNSLLQTHHANVKFRVSRSTATEIEWECSRLGPSGNEITVNRSRVTSTETSNLHSNTARQTRGQQQITGFNLNGDGAVSSNTETVTGHEIGSCPHASGVVWDVTFTGEDAVDAGPWVVEVYCPDSGEWRVIQQ